jgi:hypothetical protein
MKKKINVTITNRIETITLGVLEVLRDRFLIKAINMETPYDPNPFVRVTYMDNHEERFVLVRDLDE